MCDADNSAKLHRRIVTYRPKFSCINFGSNAMLEEKMKNKQFMESLFPRASNFEK